MTDRTAVRTLYHTWTWNYGLFVHCAATAQCIAEHTNEYVDKYERMIVPRAHFTHQMEQLKIEY